MDTCRAGANLSRFQADYRTTDQTLSLIPFFLFLEREGVKVERADGPRKAHSFSASAGSNVG
jgi:hypothetical protein